MLVFQTKFLHLILTARHPTLEFLGILKPIQSPVIHSDNKPHSQQLLFEVTGISNRDHVVIPLRLPESAAGAYDYVLPASVSIRGSIAQVPVLLLQVFRMKIPEALLQSENCSISISRRLSSLKAYFQFGVHTHFLFFSVRTQFGCIV